MKEPLLLLRDPDPAHELLLPYVSETESIMRDVLRGLDASSECQIVPAPDLGFPHDVVRMAGGFPTGCVVDWRSAEPFIPVDTTVNIDTSSVFDLSGDVATFMSSDRFDELRVAFDKSSYVFNFHKGNHFISLGRRVPGGTPVLVIHSNEKEFKYQYNGLSPGPDNWFAPRVRTYERGGRRLRYIVGDDALLFGDIAKMLEEYNIIRHRFVARFLVRADAAVLKEQHDHHYWMPTRTTVAIGSFLAAPGAVVPIFSRPGRDIQIFSPTLGGRNWIQLLHSGERKLIVPHGWGKTCLAGTTFRVDWPSQEFVLSGNRYTIAPQISIGADPNLSLRDFDDNPESPDSLAKQMSNFCPGTTLGRIEQRCSYTRNGFAVHHETDTR